MVTRFVLAIFLILSINVVIAAEVRLTFIGASKAQLDNPHDLKLTPDGRYLFVSDVGGEPMSPIRTIIVSPFTKSMAPTQG
jgi:hypothetical protein